MLFGKVLRPGRQFRRDVAFRSTRSKRRRWGATVVRGWANFVGVAAASSKLAADAVAAVHAEWKAEPQPSSKELFDYLHKECRAGEKDLFRRWATASM